MGKFTDWLLNKPTDFHGVPWRDVNVPKARRLMRQLQSDLDKEANCLFVQSAFDSGMRRQFDQLDAIEKRQQQELPI